MGRAKSKPAERYLAIPYHILNLGGIALAEKVLLSHIYSFGARGCWQSNKTLAEIFMVSGKAISRWVADICRYLYIKNPKGYYRTMWAKSHPDVGQASAGCLPSGANSSLRRLSSSRRRLVLGRNASGYR